MEWMRGNRDYARVAGRAWQPGVENPTVTRAPQSLTCGARGFHAIFGGRPGGLMLGRVTAVFRPWLARHPSFSNRTGRRATVANERTRRHEAAWLTVIPVAGDQLGCKCRGVHSPDPFRVREVSRQQVLGVVLNGSPRSPSQSVSKKCMN